jgi:fatty-acyl-CoA synthase
MQTTHDLGTPDYLMRIVNELGIPGVSNIYGMTETAGQFTMWFPDDPLAQRVQGNGRPQAGNFVRIADPHSMEVVPQGETGEIQMRGPTISPGYFGNARARAEAFTDDGWFRSGDLGRIAEQRQLVYVARLKEMIRVGGENLAPAEVEQVLRDLCQTPSACVLGMPDARLDEVAVAVLVKPQTTDWSLLVTQLRQRLAGFKVPRAIYVTDQMPMTATNRVQRATLRKAIESGQLDRVA